jgi:superfamily II DNA or RNA helicase
MLRSINIKREDIRSSTDIKISVGNVFSSVIAPRHVLTKLAKAFSYEDPKADKKRKHRIKYYTDIGRPDKVEFFANWDGRNSVFDSTTVGSGILEDVIMYLHDQGYTVNVVDNTRRGKKAVIPLGPRMKTLTDDQQVAFDILESRDFRGLVHAAMAWGKTVLGTKIIHHLQTITVIVADRTKTIDEWRNEIRESFNVMETKLKGASAYTYGSYQTRRPVILLCSNKLIANAQMRSADPQTIERNHIINGLIQNSGLYIYDEVHHASAQKTKVAVAEVRSYHRIGLSGTIGIRDDNSDYVYYALIGNPVYFFSSTDLVNMGRGKKVLIKPIVLRYDQSFLARVNADRGDWPELYKNYIMENQRRNNTICSVVIDEASEGKHILILIDRIDHAQVLAAKLGQKLAVWTHGGETKELQELKFHQFTTGQIPVMICTFSLAGEGFNYPELNVLVIAGGKAEIKIRQAMGRVMRKSVHDTATLYDFVDPIQPFKDHFLARLEIYNSEDAFELEDNGRHLPYWARNYLG